MRFEGRLFIPLFSTERLFPSVGNLELKLYFNSSEFCLMATKDESIPDAHLQIERMDLKMKRIMLSEQAQIDVESLLQREKRLLYPLIGIFLEHSQHVQVTFLADFRL